MVGIAGVILAIILITGHPEPPTPARSTAATPQPVLAPTERIRKELLPRAFAMGKPVVLDCISEEQALAPTGWQPGAGGGH